MLWRVLQKIEPWLVKAYRGLREPPAPNAKGDRDIEYSWIAANMPAGPGHALDFGCGPGWLGLMAARRGFEVTAVDLRPIAWHYKHPELRFLQQDIMESDFPAEHFDLVINCSAIEHVGLSGRYGTDTSRSEGDMEAMAVLHRITKPGGTMLLTIPVGRDKVWSPYHRIYGNERLPKLLNGWDVVAEEYWVKDSENRWLRSDRTSALGAETVLHYYPLGLFVLRRADRGREDDS